MAAKPPLKSNKGDQRGDVDDSVEIFPPSNETTIIAKGTLFYHDSVRAWNTLRFKKEILDKFPRLKNKNKKGVYLMKLPTSYDALIKEVKRLKETHLLPIMIFLGQEKE